VASSEPSPPETTPSEERQLRATSKNTNKAKNAFFSLFLFLPISGALRGSKTLGVPKTTTTALRLNEKCPRRVRPSEAERRKLVGIGNLDEMTYICAVKSKWAWFLSKLIY
jgi:hypothetical protein